MNTQQNQDLFWRNSWKTTSIQERRGLWISQMIEFCSELSKSWCLEMLKSMVILFQQARFQFSRLYMDHVWFMDVWIVWQSRERGFAASSLVVVQPFPQYWIKVGYGCEGGSSLYEVDVCKKVKMLSKQATHNLPNSSSNEAQKQFCVRVSSLIFYALPHYLLALLFASGP